MRGSRNTTITKNSPKFLECILRPKFLECICLKKTPSSFPLAYTYTSKKTKEMVKITKSTRSLFLLALFLSLFLSFVPFCCAFFAFVFFLFLLSCCVCVCVCVRVGVSSGLIFASRSFVSISTARFLLVHSRTDVSSLY